MKHIIYASALLLASTMTGEAMAACTTGGSWTQVTTLVTTLTNNNAALGMTACSLAGQGTQEEHHNDNTLWDYKLGNSDPIDPRKQIGTWSVANDGTTSATVSYLYDGVTNSGPYTVYTDGTNYDFCDGTNTSVGTFTLVAATGTSRVCP